MVEVINLYLKSFLDRASLNIVTQIYVSPIQITFLTGISICSNHVAYRPSAIAQKQTAVPILRKISTTKLCSYTVWSRLALSCC